MINRDRIGGIPVERQEINDETSAVCRGSPRAEETKEQCSPAEQTSVFSGRSPDLSARMLVGEELQGARRLASTLGRNNEARGKTEGDIKRRDDKF